MGWETFFHKYRHMKPEDRRYSEVIRENDPVKFYIDAELYRADNPRYTSGSKDESDLLDATRDACLNAIIKCFPHVNREQIKITELDSSDDDKLSRHMIFDIDGKILENSRVAGIVCSNLINDTPDKSPLWIRKGNKREHFIDSQVYRKNGTLRIYKSTKSGQYRFLHALGEKQDSELNLTILRDTLITYVPAYSHDNLAVLSLAYKRRCSLKTREITLPKRMCVDRDVKTEIKTEWDSNHWLYEELRDMFDRPVYNGGLSSDGDTMMFWVNDKNCEFIEREHKGNHITYRVYLHDKIYRQGCQDTECRGKLGVSRPVPESYHDSIDRYLRDEYKLTEFASIFS
jgi:hypothetical protein